MNHHHAVIHQLRQAVTTVTIALYNCQVHAIGHNVGRTNGNASASHNHHIAHIGILFLARNLAYVGDVFLGGHEIDDIILVNRIVTPGDNRLMPTLDGHHVVRDIGSTQFVERDVQYFRTFAQLHTQQHQSATTHFPPLAYPAHLHGIHNLFSCQHFGEYQGVDTHLFPKILMLGKEVFIVVDTRHRLACSQVVGNHASGHVAALVGCDGNEQVGISHTGILQTGNGRWRSHHGHQVEIVVELAQPLLAFIHQHDVLSLSGEQLGQVGAHFSSSGNDYFHIFNALMIPSSSMPQMR